MSTAAFAFDDQSTARRATATLKTRGIADEAIRVHTAADAGSSAAGQIDELVTGGFIQNFANLFEGIFHGNDAADRATLFARVAESGGEVVSVNINSEAEQTIVDEVMEAESPALRTEWTAASGK